MYRRDALKTLVLAAAGGGISSTLNAMDDTALDRYGGWTGKRFTATGFFRVEKDQRWWIVTYGTSFDSFDALASAVDWR